MTTSFEIDRKNADEFPPFVDGCETCLPTGWNGGVVPFATVTNGDSLTAFYHHLRCGKKWFTSFGARWSHTWVRVGSEPTHALPGGRRQIAAGPSDGNAVAA